MSKIVIIGAGAMGSAFAMPCLDNNHDINIVGTHLENDFIDDLQKNNNLHPGLNTKIPKEIKILKFEKFDELLKSNVDLIVLGISSKGIEWVADQLSRLFKDNKIPKLLMLTKGLSIHNNQYELLVDKLERLLLSNGIKDINLSLQLEKKALTKNYNYVDYEYRKEQLWGENLQKATEILLQSEQLKEDVILAKSKINASS